MKIMKILVMSLVVAVVLTVGVKGLSSIFKTNAPTTVTTAEAASSKVDQRILRAQQTIGRMPAKSEGYNQLASAYMQKAREIGDLDFNEKADSAIAQSLKVEPDNYDALKLRAKLQLTNHRFAEALETARRAQRFRNDDHDVWGQITDALVELGDYPGAVKAAEKMINLRPDSSAYARISYLRSLHGDIDGAIQAMRAAVQAANPNDPEAIAWCRVQLGNELMNAGKLDIAELQFDEALLTFPGHHLALQAKARARVVAGDIQAAVQIYKREQEKGPSADTAQALGDLYTLLGRSDEAKAEFASFESLEPENVAVEKSWRHMVNYWLDHDVNLEESLRLASAEYESRKDIFTCDSQAWALFKNGNLAEAKKVINEALRTGTKDARINYHAGAIYKALGLRNKAVQHLRLAVANPSFDPMQMPLAKNMLVELTT